MQKSKVGKCRKTCPVTGCQESIPETVILCKAHWYSVAMVIRNAICLACAESERGDGCAELRRAAIFYANRRVEMPEKGDGKGTKKTP
jgi:hypothetical protein